MSRLAASARATGLGLGRAGRGPSAATLQVLREADATMSPGERDEYAGPAGSLAAAPYGNSLGHSPFAKKEGN
jgi:hypothetical protein